jgi:hypothetical protein
MPGIKAVRLGGGQQNYLQAFFLGVSQKKAFTGTSAQSAAVAAATEAVYVTADQDCFLATGANPTALNDGTSFFLRQYIPTPICLTGGDKIAVISNGTNGNLYITEMLKGN